MKSIVLVAVLLGLLLPGCAKQAPTVSVSPASPVVSADPASGSLAGTVVGGQELFCLADTQEEAEEIAAQYGLELVDFSYGVATFHTQEDPMAVIARGKKNGWPELSLNTTVTLTDPVKPSGIKIP